MGDEDGDGRGFSGGGGVGDSGRLRLDDINGVGNGNGCKHEVGGMGDI